MTLVARPAESGMFDDDDLPPTETRMITARRCPEELNIPAATVRSWARRGQLHSRALDHDGCPLYFEHEILALRNARRVALANRVATTHHHRNSTRVSTDRVLSCVKGREVAITDQTPEPALAPTEIVVPVSLDLSKAERQLGEFCDRVVRDIGQAVATGLAVHSMTVVMAPPPLPHD